VHWRRSVYSHISKKRPFLTWVKDRERCQFQNKTQNQSAHDSALPLSAPDRQESNRGNSMAGISLKTEVENQRKPNSNASFGSDAPGNQWYDLPVFFMPPEAERGFQPILNFGL
jgi:hypothetical protein